MMVLTGAVVADDSIGVCVEIPVEVPETTIPLPDPIGPVTIGPIGDEPGSDGSSYTGFDLLEIFVGTPVPEGTLGAHGVTVDVDGAEEGEGPITIYNVGLGGGSSQEWEDSCCEESGAQPGCFAPVQ
jgi:hypothetical protein